MGLRLIHTVQSPLKQLNTLILHSLAKRQSLTLSFSLHRSFARIWVSSPFFPLRWTLPLAKLDSTLPFFSVPIVRFQFRAILIGSILFLRSCFAVAEFVLGVEVSLLPCLKPLNFSSTKKVREARAFLFSRFMCLFGWFYVSDDWYMLLVVWKCVDFFTRERVVSSAELAQASRLVAQNESSRLSEELSLERGQQQLTPSLFRGLV